jgi:hypothetical protein
MVVALQGFNNISQRGGRPNYSIPANRLQPQNPYMAQFVSIDRHLDNSIVQVLLAGPEPAQQFAAKRSV